MDAGEADVTIDTDRFTILATSSADAKTCSFDCLSSFNFNFILRETHNCKQITELPPPPPPFSVDLQLHTETETPTTSENANAEV